MEASNNNEVIEDLKPKRRGRPKTNSLDKKEYQKEYYKKNKESLLEQKKEYYNQHKDEILEHQKEYQKEYMQNLKDNNPDKFKSIREKNNEASKDYHMREQQAFRFIKSIIENGELYLNETHKETLSKYNVIRI